MGEAGTVSRVDYEKTAWCLREKIYRNLDLQVSFFRYRNQRLVGRAVAIEFKF